MGLCRRLLLFGGDNLKQQDKNWVAFMWDTWFRREVKKYLIFFSTRKVGDF